MKTIIISIFLMTIVCSSSVIGQGNDNNAASPLELTTTIPLYNVTGRIGHMAYNSKQQLLYIAALSNCTMEIIDLQNKKKLPSVKALRQPCGIDFVPGTDMIFVACLGDGLCKVFDANTYKEARTQNLGGKVNTVRYTPMSQQLYIGYGEGNIAVYDANAIKLKSTIKLPAQPESFQIDENSNMLYVNIPKNKEIEVVDLKSNVVKSTWKIEDAAENYPLALDAENHRLFIGCRTPAKLLVYDLETGKKIASVDIDGDVDDIFFNKTNKQLYVSCGDGYLDVIKQEIKEVKKVIKQETKSKPVAKSTKGKKGAKPVKQAPPKETIQIVKQDSYEIVSKVYTAAGARTSLLIPELNQIVVAAPAASGKDAQLMIYQIK